MAREVARIADGVVVGSALVKVVSEHGGSAELVERYEAFARSLAEASHGVDTSKRKGKRGGKS
jgi:tryptophan synthase alpha subunit